MVDSRIRIWLDRCIDHLPERSSNKAQCQLHRWVDGRKEGGAVLLCSACNVNLCIDCYGLFHRVPDLVAMKQGLMNKYTSNTDEKKTATKTKTSKKRRY